MSLVLVGAPFCLAAGAPTGFGGTVYDPGGLVVPNARVALLCAAHSESAVTDHAGHFLFLAKRDKGVCELEVRRPGFSLYRSRIDAAISSVTIQLALAPNKNTVNVVGQPDAFHRLPPGSVSLSDEELQNVPGNTSELIRYAKVMAGISAGEDAVYVDGMPSSTLPPRNMIERITVNADVFSAEYGDGGYTHIEITTKSPDRHFRVGFGSTALGAGGGDAIKPTKGSVSRSGSGFLAGSVWRLPVTFSLRLNWAENFTPVSIEAVPPSGGFVNLTGSPRSANPYDSAPSVTRSSRAASLFSDAFYRAGESLQLHFSYSVSRSSGSNLGAGGLALPDTGTGSQSINRTGQLTYHAVWAGLSIRGGLAANMSDSAMHAFSSAAGLTVAGVFSAGGPLVTGSHDENAKWNWKSVVEPLTGCWSAGVTASESGEFKSEVPNAHGSFTFPALTDYETALNGNSVDSWSVLRGNGAVSHWEMVASPFFQEQLIHRPHFQIIAGLRGDYQSAVGLLLSPRLSTALEWHGLLVRAGAGVFARPIPNYVFVKQIEDDGSHLQQFLLSNVSLENIDLPSTTPGAGEVRTEFTRAVRMPREIMSRASIERRFSIFTPSVEYTWARDRHLLGSRRFADGADWLDLIEENRNSERHTLLGQVSSAWKQQRLIASYERVQSWDDNSGPFSFPEFQDNIRAEWSRSAGIAPNNASIGAYLNLPLKIFLTLTDTWHSSAPYNITLPDELPDELFNDRGGLRRNSGNGPAYNSLSLYLSRQFPLPVRLRVLGHGVLIGLQGDNLINNKNYLTVGSILGSPTFGQPLSAAPSRSVRLWLNFN